jgi:hypothetical protein
MAIYWLSERRLATIKHGISKQIVPKTIHISYKNIQAILYAFFCEFTVVHITDSTRHSSSWHRRVKEFLLPVFVPYLIFRKLYIIRTSSQPHYNYYKDFQLSTILFLYKCLSGYIHYDISFQTASQAFWNIICKHPMGKLGIQHLFSLERLPGLHSLPFSPIHRL